MKLASKPYLTPAIKAMIRERNKLQRKYARRPITYGDEYRKLRNKVTQTIRIAKSNYFKRQLEIHRGNSRKVWGIINSVLNRIILVKTKVQLFEVDGNQITNPSAVAEKFNDFFVSIGQRLAEQVPNQAER